jgi:hypothetical protein
MMMDMRSIQILPQTLTEVIRQVLSVHACCALSRASVQRHIVLDPHYRPTLLLPCVISRAAR